MPDSMPKRALLSVTNKDGIADFASELVRLGFELVSTGGTAKSLQDAGLPVTQVAEVTGFPEMLDGRVKTLHPKIHGGLLGDVQNPKHRQEMTDAGIQAFQLVAVNLYEFEKTVTRPHNIEEAVESIDIGGPAMVRASAKNHKNVLIVTNPSDYSAVVSELEMGVSDQFRRELAAKAFAHTAYYDSLISEYLLNSVGTDRLELPTLTIGLRKSLPFRYGENPHQSGALYQAPLSKTGVAQARQLWGKELSYNNLNDAHGAWELVCDLPETSCAIIKHSNPCGASRGSSLADAYRLARQADPISAFGGIAAFNQPLDVDAALAMTEKGNFLEVILAPAFSDEVVEIFKSRSGWGQDVRLLEVPLSPTQSFLSVKSIRGGFIVQDSDEDPKLDWRVVTESQPTDEEMSGLRFLWSVVQHVKSNAIVVGKGENLLGVGAGQMNRVQSVRLALEQTGKESHGAVLASDAFFPFPDSVETAAAAGIRAIVQPGGSKKDDAVIARANELQIAMCFTGVRHFNH